MAMTRAGVRRQYGAIAVQWFFDRPKVRAAVEKGLHKALFKIGGKIRETARAGIRKKGKAKGASFADVIKKAKPGMGVIRAALKWEAELLHRPASRPGSPPYTHTGFLRDDIGFAYDDQKKSVVTGTHRSTWLGKLHEHGGTRQRWKVYRLEGAKKTWAGAHAVYTGGRKVFARMIQGQLVGRFKPPKYVVERSRDAIYPARPFMQPAREKCAKRGVIAKALANVVK